MFSRVRKHVGLVRDVEARKMHKPQHARHVAGHFDIPQMICEKNLSHVQRHVARVTVRCLELNSRRRTMPVDTRPVTQSW